MSEDRARLVYVVDDEQVIARTLADILRHYGYAVESFTSAEDALEAAKLRGPSILITDVVMGNLNGIDLAVQIVALYPDCKVLIIGGPPTTDHIREMAAERGHNFPILLKPMHPNVLLAAVTEL